MSASGQYQPLSILPPGRLVSARSGHQTYKKDRAEARFFIVGRSVVAKRSGETPENNSSFGDKLRGHANRLGNVESKRPVPAYASESPCSTIPCALDFCDRKCGWVS
jgi:hypothetical protein